MKYNPGALTKVVQTGDLMVNNLIRAFLYAAVALTVDVLWGYTGVLTFGQSAFFGIGVYAVGLIFTHAGFNLEYAALAFAAAVVGAVIVALLVGWLAFYHGASPLYASVVTLVLPIVVTQVMPQHELMRTEFFNDFLARDGRLDRLQGRAEHLGDAEITQINMPVFVEKNVRRLHVAVYVTSRVHEIECLGDAR